MYVVECNKCGAHAHCPEGKPFPHTWRMLRLEMSTADGNRYIQKTLHLCPVCQGIDHKQRFVNALLNACTTKEG